MEKYNGFNKQAFFRGKAGQLEFLLKKLPEMKSLPQTKSYNLINFSYYENDFPFINLT